jgi:hypothetical protein
LRLKYSLSIVKKWRKRHRLLFLNTFEKIKFVHEDLYYRYSTLVGRIRLLCEVGFVLLYGAIWPNRIIELCQEICEMLYKTASYLEIFRHWIFSQLNKPAVIRASFQFWYIFKWEKVNGSHSNTGSTAMMGMTLKWSIFTLTPFSRTLDINFSLSDWSCNLVHISAHEFLIQRARSYFRTTIIAWAHQSGNRYLYSCLRWNQLFSSLYVYFFVVLFILYYV